MLRILGAVVVAALLSGRGQPVWAAPAGGAGVDEGRSLTRLVSEAGESLLVTGLRLAAGDRFLTPDNRLFEVTGVREGVARARLVRRVDLGAVPRPTLLPALRPAGPAFGVGAARAPSGTRPSGVLVAVYHTHSDESYLPDAGRTNVPWNGDIFQVGAAMAQAMRQDGLSVLHSLRRHDPHDGMAYARSRRTALALLRRRPAALFDVHRDTPPAEVYLREVVGRTLASVLLVVGRQNPNIGANEAFAFTIKGYADRAYPGLIRGILYAAGDYNQDLFPRSLLAEVGSTYNRLEEAQAGASLFGDVVSATLADVVPAPGLPAPDAAAGQRRLSARGWQNAVLLLTLTAAGISLYLLLNEGSYQRLSRLVSGLGRQAEHVGGALGALAGRAAAAWRRLTRRSGLTGGR